MRNCDGCTKCCEGWLSGQAHGKPFSPGNPCFFVSIGKGCSIYSKRPEEPCKTYKCGWISDPDNIPEWMKPSEINAIVDVMKGPRGNYYRIVEAGAPLSSNVLSYMVKKAAEKKVPIEWKVGETSYHLGPHDFTEEYPGSSSH